MTQQYLAGELSVLLAEVAAVATTQGSLDAAVRLRHLAETLPVAELTFVVVRALELINDLCWGSLQRGDVVAFTHQAALGAELHEFGVCACLLSDT